MSDREPALAVLVDFENMARPGIKGRDDFDVAIVLNRLADKGRVLVKRAYADWSRYRDARHALISAGLELIEMPSAREGAKNRADIKMAVDAMELVYSREHLDNFVLVSGDSDFTPLVGKLRELNKRVIGVGNRESASELLIANCDEFIFYDKLAGTSRARRGTRTDPVELLTETLAALSHESTELPLASVVKDSMRRKSPAFDETDLGFANFSKFLEDVAEKGHVTLQTDPRSGTYRVEMPEEGRGTVTAVRPRQASDREEAGDGRRRRRRSRRRGGREDGAEEGGAEVFEFVVASDPEADGDEAVEATVVVQDISAGLPPLDEPISYEHVVLLAPELDLGPEDETELVEASDATIAEEPAPTGRRRRKVSAETAETPVEPTTAEAEEADATPGRRRRVRRRTLAEAPEGTPAAYAEPVSAPAQEAAATPEADAPTETPAVDETSRRRRTVRRRGASAGETPADATPEAAEPEAEEKPKRRRSSRAKAAEPAAEEKPKRRRSSRAKAAEPEAEVGEASAVGEAAEPEAEEKPKRRRSSRAKAAEPEAGAGEASAVGEAAEPEAGEPAAEEKPKRRRGSRAQAAEPEAEAAEAIASNAGDPTADATPEAAGPEAEERPKRRRRTARAAVAADEES